jgi:hypothetical protein
MSTEQFQYALVPTSSNDLETGLASPLTQLFTSIMAEKTTKYPKERHAYHRILAESLCACFGLVPLTILIVVWLIICVPDWTWTRSAPYLSFTWAALQPILIFMHFSSIMDYFIAGLFGGEKKKSKPIGDGSGVLTCIGLALLGAGAVCLR